eukprot:gene10280-biopygen9324
MAHISETNCPLPPSQPLLVGNPPLSPPIVGTPPHTHIFQLDYISQPLVESPHHLVGIFCFESESPHFCGESPTLYQKQEAGGLQKRWPQKVGGIPPRWGNGRCGWQARANEGTVPPLARAQAAARAGTPAGTPAAPTHVHPPCPLRPPVWGKRRPLRLATAMGGEERRWERSSGRGRTPDVRRARRPFGHIGWAVARPDVSISSGISGALGMPKTLLEKTGKVRGEWAAGARGVEQTIAAPTVPRGTANGWRFNAVQTP